MLEMLHDIYLLYSIALWVTTRHCPPMQEEHAAALEDRTASLQTLSTQHASELEVKLEQLKCITEAKVDEQAWACLQGFTCLPLYRAAYRSHCAWLRRGWLGSLRTELRHWIGAGLSLQSCRRQPETLR
jgi:hypothetical protein